MSEILLNNVYSELLENKRLRELGMDIIIPYPFTKFSTVVPGTAKGRIVLITAQQKCGKTKITDYLYLYSPIEYVLNNKSNIIPKIFYFTLEISKEDKVKEAMCYYLYSKFNIRLSMEKLSSYFKDYILHDEVVKILNGSDFKYIMNKFLSYVTFIDDIRNPYGIYKTMRDYAHNNGVYIDKDGVIINTKELEKFDLNNEKLQEKYYIPNDPNEYILCILDNLNLIQTEKERNTKYLSMENYMSNYALKMRDRWKYIPVVVQQQTLQQEDIEHIKSGNLEPSSEGLADYKASSKDANIMLGLFQPSKYKRIEHAGYDLKALKGFHRELSIILNRHGDTAKTQLWMDGATGYYEELPNVIDIKGRYEQYTNKKLLI